MFKIILAKVAALGIIVGLALILVTIFVIFQFSPKYSFAPASLNPQYFSTGLNVAIAAVVILGISLISLKISGSTFLGITGIQFSWPVVIIFLAILVDVFLGTTGTKSGVFTAGAIVLVSLYYVFRFIKNKIS